MRSAIIKVGILSILSTFLFTAGFSSAAISQEYYPNYKIDKQWNEIIELLTTLEAYKGTGKNPPSTLFSRLNKDFKTVFKYFPSDPNYKIVYEQCLITTQMLSASVNYDNFLLFRDKCFEPINRIIKEIDKKFTVKAKIKASPISGSAPLTATFDARDSVDPSNDTIPTDNYLWYFKDTAGVSRIIGRGPVVNYTFQQPGAYVVHLTVRSANFETKGVFDGDQSVSINVGPKAAFLSVYVNGKKLKQDYKEKVGTEEAKNGLNVDATGTYPTGGRKIVSYKLEVSGGEGFNFTKSGNGNPGALRLKLPSNGEYQFKLSISDNENNNISETYNLVVSDPIATIKVGPNDGNTSNTFTFDASLSYSIQSRLKTYKWTIFDPNANQIDSFEGKTFQRRFNLPGNYTIKLSVADELGNTNDDQIKFYVDSTSPVPQFLIKPVRQWKNPSQYILDAGPTYDLDVTNGFDSLKYEWRLSNDKVAKVQETYDNGLRALVTFDEPGTYKAKLIVTDRFNKISEIEKDIEIRSTLRPEVVVTPSAVNWGDKVNFSVKSNKPIGYYQWDFGDGGSIETSDSNISYTYKKSGAYNAKLTVRTKDGEENELTVNVFIGEKGYPIGIYSLKVADRSLTQDDICTQTVGDSSVDFPAFSVDRYESFLLDSADSVNSKGTKENLKVTFKPQNDEMFQTNQLSYKFSEVGCQYVEMWVEDTIAKKTDKKVIYIKVNNALPLLQNLSMIFPQYGNETGIGFNQNDQKKDIFAVDYDPLIVKVVANGSKDPDGFISHYMWYYYKIDDPTRIIELKVTPSTVPYIIFSLPRIPGEFAFGVKMVDSDGGEISSEDVIGKGPIIFFPPDTKNLDIPIVTLKNSKVNVNVGEEVKFSVVAKILSTRNDFNANRIIKYDFDGDGEYDLTTKKDQVTYVYEKDGVFKPKVKVLYRGYGGIGYGENIDVKKGLRSSFVYDNFGKKVIVRDISYGEVDTREFCMDAKKCNKENSYIVPNKEYFEFDYLDIGKYYIKHTLKDKYGNEEFGTAKLDLDEPGEKDLGFMSLPKSINSGSGYQIEIGKSLDNSILFYMVDNSTGNCYIDADITSDGNNDGTPDNDKDILCNQLVMHSYTPKAGSTIARLHYGNKQTKDITINFIDFDIKLTPEQVEIYEQLGVIIDSIDPQKDETLSYLKTLLVNLRNGLTDRTEIDSLLIQIQQLVDENNGNEKVVSISTDLKPIFDKLTDKSVKAAIGGTPYEAAKADIMIFIPDEAKTEIEKFFKDLEDAGGDKEKIKSILQQLLTYVEDLGKNGKLDETSINIIRNDVCDILKYYEIPSKACGTDSSSQQTDSQPKSILWTIIKVLGIIFGIIAVVFIILIVVFAIKAKKVQHQENLGGESDKKSE